MEQNSLSNEELFKRLYSQKDEEEVNAFISDYPDAFEASNWRPLGNNLSNYGVVKNQQSNPIAALIEKITNSIDAILMKKCFESGEDPKSDRAPQSMETAIATFFPNSNWDLSDFRRRQAEEIQIFADGKGPEPQSHHYATSVVIYDNGEGQHPEAFEKTFLALLSGNKNEIQFVQGKFTMGGSGAIVFCGKNRYQLIASRRFDKSGNLGFTLVREHPRRDSDKSKETWYEYLLVNGKIPSFPIDSLDLGLMGRKFESGTVVKLYSYQFPKGYSAFSQDLNQSINEYLFNPALPILTWDTQERYPNNKVLVTDLLGLKWRLFKEESDYLEKDGRFTEEYRDELFGEMRVSCFVFKNKVKGYDLKKTEEIISNRYFKNGMAVLFSLNGQVHGHYTSEFITRSLKLNLLKKSLLIHVDCTNMRYEFRKELFMASRDRLKDGEETQALRRFLAEKLGDPSGRLAEIEKRRKMAVDIDSSTDTKELLSQFTKTMPLDSELLKLIGQTFKLDQKSDQGKQKGELKTPAKPKQEEPFNPRRFPTKFRLKAANDGENEVAKIPIGGQQSIRFETDVEDDYFDRIDEPGELRIALLQLRSNTTHGGNRPGWPNSISEVFNVVKSSPHNGIVKIALNPTVEVAVGDAIRLKVTMTAPDKDFDEVFWVKIAEKNQPKERTPRKNNEDEQIGLPPLIFAYKEKENKKDGAVSWEDVESATSLEMNFKTVMVPDTKGDTLQMVFVNMESSVLLNYKAKFKNPNQEQIEIANRKYFTAVYFHTLFLYSITKNRGYQISKVVEGKNDPEDVDVGTYLKDIFDNFYSEFIMNFGGTDELMWGIGE